MARRRTPGVGKLRSGDDPFGAAQRGFLTGLHCQKCGVEHGTKTERGYAMLSPNVINRKTYLFCGFCAQGEVRRLTP